MSNKNTLKKGEFTGRHMAIIMVAFFGVIITVNLTMATFANRSWTGLVVKNGYVESQHFNAKLKNARAQTALDWKGTFSESDTGIRFELRQDDGKPLVAEKVTVMLRRPATEAMDKRVVLRPTGHGIYEGNFKLDNGKWSAEIVADVPFDSGKSVTDHPVHWRMNYNIFVKSDGSFSPVTNAG